jgi:PAS domain S-box-containing protein
MAAQYAAAKALAESASLSDATPRILRAICESLGWAHGSLWQVAGDAGVLACVETWHAPGLDLRSFDAVSREMRFAPGVGLPGRVYKSRRPAWIPDVVRDSNFPRAKIADADGLHGALGFPIVLGAHVLGVMEFFSQEIQEPDDELLALLGTVGSQIGQFMERKQAEEELDRFFSMSLDMLCIAGTDGHFKRVNAAWQKTLGYTRDELMARPYLDFIHPDDREETVRRAAGLEKGVNIVSFENRYACRDGTYRWLFWKATFDPDEQRIYATARDVTAIAPGNAGGERGAAGPSVRFEMARHRAENAARVNPTSSPT